MPDRLDAIRGAFDERAATYDESAMHRAVAAAVAEFVDLDGVRTVLDAATGTGLVLRALARLTGEVRLFGVDISPGMLDVARRELPGADLLVADAALLPFATASVDVVTCVTALHILPDVPAAAGEWHRVLRPGGALVTATFCSPHPVAPVPDAAASPPYPRDHAPYSGPEILERTFRPLGFALRRHAVWTDGNDDVLIAELVRTPLDPDDAHA